MLRYLLTAIFLTFLTVSSAFAGDAKPPRTITLAGHGEVRMAPDLALVMIGVMSQGDTAGDALKTNTAAMQAVLAALKAARIEDKDIQTSNFTVQPRYDYNNSNNQPPRLIGYDVSNNVTVAVRAIDNLGAVLDQAVSAGSNQINGILFQVSKPEASMDEARKLAVEDAMRKAKVYAGAGTVVLGEILSISEGSGNQPPIPLQDMARADMAASVPIARGEQVISVDVNMVWEIK
ncbi:MAG: SIMPL domain-containing protein [Rhizobiales bacterium]|nr:SIMPL domain-containing protein [Hyphomicrobiales bacterium]